MLLSPDALALLRVALRARPSGITELLALTDLPEPAAESAVAELSAAGFLHPDGDALVVPPPEAAVSDRIFDDLAAQAERITAEHTEIRGSLTQLRSLLQDWRFGEGGAPIDVELVHGPMAPRDAGMMLYSRNPSLCSWGVIPDAHRLEAPPSAVLDNFIEMLRRKPAPDRIILGPYDAATPELVRALEVFTSAGADIRIHDRLPSWFGVNSDDSVVLPAVWGETWPDSVMIVRHPGLAGVARDLFDRLWSQAQSIAPDDATWRPLVRLMATGSSLEAAARALGISPRTARRRLNEAMRHHRAHTPFELGVAIGRAEHGEG